MGNSRLANAAKGIFDALGEEFRFAVEDIRHKVVEQGWFGHATTPETPDFYRWQSEAEPLAPAVEAAKQEAVIEQDAVPPEGRPSNLEERESEATAYARHKEAGPYGVIEIENLHAMEWRDVQEWVGGGSSGIEEPEEEEPAIEVEGLGY